MLHVSASVGFKDNISTYVALSGDLHVIYSLPANVTLPPNIIVQLILFDVQKNATGSVLETFNLPIARSHSGEFTYICGKIDLPGSYKVRLLESLKAPALAETRLLTVVWPQLNMTMPVAHTALSGEIPLYILEQNHIEHRHCRSAHENREYYVEIVRNVSGEGSEGAGKSKQLVDKISITGLENLIGAELMFECPMFDQAGVYQAYIRFEGEPEPPVAASNEMQVTWSSAYMLSTLKATSVFPCKNNFKVQYGHATCQSAGGDKIRLYEQLKRAKGNVASPVDLKYVGERRIETTEGATSGFVTFECELFQATSIGYCFKYLSASSNGAIRIQKTICLPTIYTPGI